MDKSKIGWTDDTSNPIQVKGGGFYCVKVSAGCKHCYAERVNKMICGFQNVEAFDYKVMTEPPPLVLREDMLAKWAKLGRPRKIFVTSMSDVFGEFVPKEWVFKILDAMCTAWKQTFQVLTKRDQRMRELVNEFCDLRGYSSLPKNIWLVVSVEDQDATKRALNLIATKCQVKGLSIEPLIGEVNLAMPQTITLSNGEVRGDAKIIEYVHWLIVGGESGGEARMMNPMWVYSLRKQAKMYNVPFFFKQWGEWVGGKLDKLKGKVLLQDGGIFYTGPGMKPFHDWREPHPDNSYYSVVSSRVGRKPRDLHWLAEPKVTQSDNDKLDGEYVMEFPPFYNVAEK